MLQWTARLRQDSDMATSTGENGRSSRWPNLFVAGVGRAGTTSLWHYLRQHPDVLLTLNMVGGSTFRTRDFVDFGGMEASEAKLVVKQLLKWNVIRLKTRGDIGMAPELIRAIREIEEED